MKKLVVSLSIAIALVSCKKKTEQVNMHYNYFGNEKGRYAIYNAKEINHLGFYTSETNIYQLKTVIGDTVHDNTGKVGNKYFRYIRNNENDPWTLKDVWFIIRENNEAILVEENEKMVKLVFAPLITKEWDANAYNTLGKLQCQYDKLHEPFSIGGMSFDSTITVNQEKQFNLISYRQKYEVYAKNVGLVKKHYQHLNISDFDVTKISSGKEVFYDLVAYGRE